MANLCALDGRILFVDRLRYWSAYTINLTMQEFLPPASPVRRLLFGEVEVNIPGSWHFLAILACFCYFIVSGSDVAKKRKTLKRKPVCICKMKDLINEGVAFAVTPFFMQFLPH